MAKRKASTADTSAGIQELRKDEMMSRLLDALDDGTDIGHYGRLVFTMVGRHFLSEDELVEHLGNDRDFSADAARALYQQVQERDYNPPRREKIMEWQAQQEFQLLPNPEDPDAGNVYRDLTFPDGVYHDIAEYHEHKAGAGHE
jgi:hypothetical protein